MGLKKQTNAKPESGCVVCTDEVKKSQDALECTMCQKWCHRQCPTTKMVNIRDAIYLAHCDDDLDLDLLMNSSQGSVQHNDFVHSIHCFLSRARSRK